MNEQNGAKENFRFFGKNAKIPRTKNELVLEDGDGAAPSSILPSVNDHHTEEKAANVSAANNSTNKHERANTNKEPQPSATASVNGFEEPCHPDIHFPGRRIGTETFERSFQKSWFGKWKWLHYISEKDTVLCFTCCKALEKGLRHTDRKTHAFVVGGFCNWRKATTKFSQHELSDIHTESVRMIASLNNIPINALLSEIVEKDQHTARTVLELLFRSIKFLGREGLPLRGHNNRDGVLWNLMMERT